MKIAQIVCVFPPYKGGMGNVALEYAQIISKEHNSIVFTPNYKKNKNVIFDFQLRRLKPVLFFGNAALIPSLFLKLKDFDIIHFHYPFFGADFVLFFFLIFHRKTKLVLHYHMDVEFTNFFLKIFQFFSNLIKPYIFKRAEKITCASLDYIAHSDVRSIYKKNQEKFFEIPFSVDVNRFFPEKKKKKKLKDINIIFVGGLDKAHYFKGLKLLINSLSKLNELNWKLKIIGSGDLMENYKDYVRKIGLERKIYFLGDVSPSDLPLEYRSSDFLVLSSVNKNEAFGLVLIEAMASGIPVIASDLYGVRTVFKNEEHGFYFKRGDKEDLIKKLKKMFVSAEIRERMGMQARSYSLDNYSQAVIEKKLLSFYENLFNK